MIVELKRATTEYIAVEDRIRLSGDVENASPVVIWLTQRLVLRVLPLLLDWLDKQTDMPLRREVIHDFAQQAAQAGIKRQPPVSTEAAREALLARSVNVTSGTELITLVFIADDEASARFNMTATQLRQWLSILHSVWMNAKWPSAPWPDWIKSEAKPVTQQTLLH